MRTRFPLAPALVLLCTALAAGPAAAQTRAALTQDVDEPARNVFALASGGLSGAPYAASFVVPANKRYVIETYTAHCDIAAGAAMGGVSLRGVTAGTNHDITAPAHYLQFNGYYSGTQVNAYAGTGAGPFYADPGSVFYVTGYDGNGGGAAKSCSFSVSGHAISNP